MSQKSHFNYEAQNPVRPRDSIDFDSPLHVSETNIIPQDADVDDVQFLVTARISYSQNEAKQGGNSIVFVDVMRRRVYNTRYEMIDPVTTAKIFECLDVASSLPEDLYEVDDETYDKVGAVQARHDDVQQGEWDVQ